MSDDNVTGNGNVISIAKGRKKSKSVGVMDIIMPYVDALLELPSREFDLPEAYGVAALKGDAKILVQIDPETLVLKPVDKEAIADCFMRFSKNRGGLRPLEPKNAATGARFWKANAKAIDAEKIAPVRELQEKGYCWHRLPFDFAPAPTPVFDELFGRMDNALAVKEWIGALLDPHAERQHYVWFHGAGGQGKGALGRFLRKIFGPSYRSEVPPNERFPDKFWTYGLIGARLVVFPDCNDARFPVTGLGKSLTGGDAIRVEKKGGDVSTAELDCMLMFMSQDKPDISGQKSDTRRVIYTQVGPLPDETQRIDQFVYDEMLWKEAPGFLAACRAAYQEMVRRGAGYSLNDEVLAELIAENEMPFEAFFDTYFELAPVDPSGLVRDQPHVSSKDMQAVLRAEGRWVRQQGPFMSWLRRQKGLHSQPVKLENGTFERRYLGVKLARAGMVAVGNDVHF